MNDWKRSFYAVWMAQWLSIAGFSFVIPFTPLFVQELGVTDLKEVEWWSGVLTAATSITVAVFSPLWGAMSDRYGRKLMVQRAMFGAGIVVAGMALARGVHDLLALRLLQGVVAGTVSASVTLAAAVSPRALLGRNLGLMQTAVFAGGSLGPLAGGLMADRLGFRPVFLVTGLVLMLGGLVVTVMVREQFTRPDGPARSGVSGFRGDLWLVLSSPVVMLMNVVLFAAHAANFAVAPVLPLFVQQLAGDSGDVASLAGMVFGAAALSSALAAAVLGRYSDRWGYRRVLIWCGLGGAVVGMLLGFAGSTSQLILLRLVHGAFIGGITPVAHAMIGVLTPPERRGSAFGLTSTATGLGHGIGPLVGAAVAAHVGIREAFVAAGALVLIVCVAAAMLPARSSGASNE